MKKWSQFLLKAAVFLFAYQIHCQETETKKNYFRLAPRFGIDFPTYQNNTPYVDYRSGLMLGLSADYYWNWFGVGADVDFIQNTPENTYPTSSLLNASSVALNAFDLKQKKITRMFYGIGPNFKYQTKSRKWAVELTGRIGYGFIRGGETELRETATVARQLLNYHAGYNTRQLLSAKGQLMFTYYFARRWGLNIGAYFLKHFNAEEDFSNTKGFSAAYQQFTYNQATQQTTLLNNAIKNRTEPCDCDVYSKGIFAGISFTFPPKIQKPKAKDCVNYALAITAKDKMTQQILPHTDVAIKDAKGNIIRTGTTNGFGAITFDNLTPDDYTIEGLHDGTALSPSSILKSEFKPDQTIQKEIIYQNSELILDGTAVICNSTQPISQVLVTMKSANNKEVYTATTDSLGKFTFKLNPQTTYFIYGKKEHYFSQTVKINAADYDRKVTLNVQVKLCLDEADCGKSIRLDNILYDLDKYDLRDESKIELDRLVQFMNDFPKVKIELSSHTDSRASNEYNNVLSQNRANAAIDYVVSRGIARERLKGVGYGETQLLNECADGVNCTEEQHQRNRRTEMKVICPEKNKP
ncbi:MAG: OmpA family protein [Flavobacteriaceae bacterium]